MNNHAHVLRARGNILPEMLNILLSYYDFVPLTSGSTGRRKLTKAALMSAKLYIPPIDEQVEIVRRVDRLMDPADSSMAHIDALGRQVERCAQAILAKAFLGELTSVGTEESSGEPPKVRTC